MRARRRNRALWIVLLLLTVALGLGSRRHAASLPGVVATYAGDILWATAAFLGIGLLLPSASTGRVALLAMSLSVLVEVGQLYHAPWIDSVRRTTFAAWCSAMTSCGATWPATPWASGRE